MLPPVLFRQKLNRFHLKFPIKKHSSDSDDTCNVAFVVSKNNLPEDKAVSLVTQGALDKLGLSCHKIRNSPVCCANGKTRGTTYNRPQCVDCALFLHAFLLNKLRLTRHIDLRHSTDELCQDVDHIDCCETFLVSELLG